MKHRQRVMCFDVMWLVVFVACAALIGRGSGATTHYNETLFHGDQGDTLDTIIFYINRTLTSNYDIEQCLSERSNYYLRPHQKLTVIILEFNKDEDIPSEYAYCEWNSKQYRGSKLVTENTVRQFIRVEIMDVGNESGDLIFWKSFYAQYRSCQVHLHLGEGAVDDTQFARYFIVMTMVLHNNEPQQVVRDLGFIDNTWITTYCDVMNANGLSLVEPLMLHRIYKNGTDYDITYDTSMLEDHNNKIHSFHLNATNNKEYNDNEIACFFDRLMYPTWKTGVRLKYYKEWWTEAGDAEVNLDLSIIILLVIIIPLTVMIIVSATYWKLKEKKATSNMNNINQRDSYQYEDVPCATFETRRPNSINNESRSSLTNSNEYHEIYDIVYEDRQRIERAHKLKITNDTPKPCLPPVETIPLRVQRTLKKELLSPPRDVSPPTTESLILPSDRYLLDMDSEGYEIPDEARFISLSKTSDHR